MSEQVDALLALIDGAEAKIARFHAAGCPAELQEGAAEGYS